MTDRQLLEMAAKAAGGIATNGLGGCYDLDRDEPWNPLTDDGDAFRLAVKLHMTVRCYMGSTCAQIAVPGFLSAYAEETNHDDPCAATRLAITRAAAAIGENMK